MKKVLIVLTSLFVLGFSAFAQDAFRPAWSIGVQGGATYSSGEATKWTDLISAPTIAVNAGYQFVPCFGIRGELSGFQSKGVTIYDGAESVYKFNYGQLNVDAVLDICNIFKFKAARVVNPYIFAGIGGNVRFNNGVDKSKLPAENYYWDGAKLGFTGRAGVGIAFRVSPTVAITLEAEDNLYSDKFNSKIGDFKPETDQNISALIGVKFTLGAAKAAREAAEAAAAAAAAEEAARLAAEKAAAEKAAAEAAAAEAARLAAEKAAAEKARLEAEAAAAAAAAKAAHEKAVADAIADPEKNVYFTIGSSYIRKAEYKKIQNLANLLKETGKKVTLRGYADKETGTPAINLPLSQKRVEVVSAALVKLGVEPASITTEFYGDTEKVSDIPAKNRVAVCIAE